MSTKRTNPAQARHTAGNTAVGVDSEEGVKDGIGDLVAELVWKFATENQINSIFPEQAQHQQRIAPGWPSPTDSLVKRKRSADMLCTAQGAE